MRRTALAFLFLLLCASGAPAATVTQRINTTSTSNGATYASASFTPAAGDLLIACAIVTATLETVARPTMTDSQSLGWTWIRPPALKATSADSLYCFVSNTTAAASSMTVTVDVTGDNGSGADINVWSISSMSRTGLSAIRQVAITSNGAAAGTPAATFANAVLTGNPVLGMVGNAASPAALTPPGGTVCNGGTFTEDADSGYATPTTGGEFVHCNSGFTASTVTWGGTSGTAFGVLILELNTAAAPPAVDMAATPTFVQHASGSGGTNSNTVGSYTLQFAQGTLSGNCVVVSLQHATSQPFVKVIDDKGNPYVQVFNNQDGNQKILNFTGVQGTSGAKKLTITLSANTAFVEVMATEFRNTNCVTDVKTGNTGTVTTSVTAGSFTPSNNNSLLYQVACLDASLPATDFFTQGASPWKLLSGNVMEGWAMQYQVQATAAAINPTMTSASNSFNSTALALQPASTGTAPAAGIHVDIVAHITGVATPPNPVKANWPSTGNLLVMSFTGQGAYEPSSIASTPSYTWTRRCAMFSSSDITQWSAENVATDTSQTISITTTGTPTGTSGPIMLYSISGAATAPYDSTMGCVEVTGNQTVSGDLTSAPNGVTPSTSNGLIIVGASQTSNLTTGMASGSPGNFIPTIEDTETSPWPVDQDNPAAIYYNPDTTTLSFSWTTSGGPVGVWWAEATAWKAPAVGGAPPSQLPTLGCCGVASLSIGNPASPGGVSSYSLNFSIAPDLISLASYPACDVAADCKAGIRICQAGTSTKCADFFAGDGQADVYLIRKQGTSATQAFKAGTMQYSAPTAFGVIP